MGVRSFVPSSSWTSSHLPSSLADLILRKPDNPVQRASSFGRNNRRDLPVFPDDEDGRGAFPSPPSSFSSFSLSSSRPRPVEDLIQQFCCSQLIETAWIRLAFYGLTTSLILLAFGGSVLFSAIGFLIVLRPTQPLHYFTAEA